MEAFTSPSRSPNACTAGPSMACRPIPTRTAPGSMGGPCAVGTNPGPLKSADAGGQQGLLQGAAAGGQEVTGRALSGGAPVGVQ